MPPVVPPTSPPCPLPTHPALLPFPLLTTPYLQARAFADFLMPMLNFLPSKRATAGQMLQHPWLRGEPAAPAPASAAGAGAAGGGSRRGLERSQQKQRSNERSRSRSRSPKRSRSPSPTPPKGYRHHSPAAAPTQQQRQQAQAQAPTKRQQAQAQPPVAALDLTASTVLLTAASGAAPKGAAPISPSEVAALAAAAAVKQQLTMGGRKSCDSNSSGQSWELVQGESGSGGAVSPA